MMQAGDYAVLPTCIRDENCLINYLKKNGFKYEKYFENDPLDRDYLIVINVIQRIYFRIDKYYLPSAQKLSEKEFLDKIKYDKYSKINTYSNYSCIIICRSFRLRYCENKKEKRRLIKI